MRHRFSSRFSPLLIAAIVGLTACGDDNDPTGGGDGGGNLSDPEVFEAAVNAAFATAAAGVIDGLNRLVTHSQGGPSNGTTITPTATGADVAVSIDIDGTGPRETVVNGSIAGDITTGAQFTISSIVSPTLPSLSASASTRGTETSPGVITFDQMMGSASADPPGSGNSASVSISVGSITLDLGTGNPTGFVDFVVSGEGQNLIVETTFQPNGSGGWEARFQSDGFDFTVP